MGLNLSNFKNTKDLNDIAQKYFAHDKFRGEFHLPGTGGYEEALYACTSGNYGNTKTKPFAILVPSDSQDVSHVLKFAKRHGIKITVVGGGHSEFSVKHDAAIVHLKCFNQVQVDAQKQTVSFGGGCILGQIGETLGKLKLAAPVGTFWTVGCGLVLQGGIGHLSRIASVACENITAVEMILPDGRIVELSEKVLLEKEELLKELWWGVRGAGTMFGIVTNVKLNVYPVSNVLKASPAKTLSCLPSEYEKIREFGGELEKCERALRGLPLDQHGDITFIVNTATHTLNAFFKLVSLEKNPFSSEVRDAFKLKENDVREDIYLDLSTKKPSESRKKGGSLNYTRTVWVDEVGSAFFEVIITALLKAPTSKCIVTFQQTGGMVRSPPEFMSDSCFRCRNFEFSVVLVAVWSEEEVKGLSEYEVDMKYRSWVDTLANDLKPIITGYYPVDIDMFRRPTSSWHEAVLTFGEEGLEKLRVLKERVDPDHIIGVHIPLSKPN